MLEPTQSLRKTASWVIRNKMTKEVIMETYSEKLVNALNTLKYEAVPILEYLQNLNASIRAAEAARVAQAATVTAKPA